MLESVFFSGIFCEGLNGIFARLAECNAQLHVWGLRLYLAMRSREALLMNKAQYCHLAINVWLC